MTETALASPLELRSRRRFPTAGSLAPWVVTLLLLLGIAFDRIMLQKPAADSEKYHAKVALAAASLPLVSDMWMASETTVDQGAVDMLKPNVIISRDYRNVATGRHVQLLLVQCKHAR